jgi:hypothetical protein
VALSVVLVVLVVGLLRDDGTGDATTATDGTTTAAAKKPKPPPELPRGGRELLPAFRVVSYAGAPQDPELGELGVGSLTGAVARLEKQGRAYKKKTRPIQPALQLISTVVHAAPGADGKYALHQPRSIIARHLRVARKTRSLLILDVQPGRNTFTSETKRLRRWLREPDVALALDPEWRMEKAGDIPGQVIGSVGAAELQASLNEVARTVRRYRLPRKLVLVHRFTEDMVRGLSAVRVPKEVQAVMSIDGVGDRANKEAKYRQLSADLPKDWRIGFKLFYREDREAGGLMTPAQVMALQPRPDVVLYE